MKKTTVIFVAIALMFSANIFAQNNGHVETIAKEIIKAYHDRNPELLKKHASGILKPAINDAYFKDEQFADILNAVDHWDNKIRGIRYEQNNILGKKLYSASVYFTDSKKSQSKIWTVDLSQIDGQEWVALGPGIAETDTVDFNKMKKILDGGKSKEKSITKVVSIEMANGEKIANSNVNQAIENLSTMDEDDNFFIILNSKDGFMQAAFSKKGFTVEYKDTEGKQYEAKQLLPKEKTIELFKEYYKKDGNWKGLTEWEEM